MVLCLCGTYCSGVQILLEFFIRITIVMVESLQPSPDVGNLKHTENPIPNIFYGSTKNQKAVFESYLSVLFLPFSPTTN